MGIFVHCFNNSNLINPKISNQVLIIAINDNEKYFLYFKNDSLQMGT